jgi:HSP20 family protein
MRHNRWMWANALELAARAERLHRQFFQRALSPTGPKWEPPLDMFETSDGLALLIALPGVPPEQIHVVIDGRSLCVTGLRPWPNIQRAAAIRRLEVPHGPFERWIELPSGCFELESKELVHGCLTLYLRRLEDRDVG